MMDFKLFAVVWPMIAVGLIVATAFFAVWLTERAERRRTR